MFGPETVLINTEKKVCARVGQNIKVTTTSGVSIVGRLRSVGSTVLTFQDSVSVGYGIVKSVIVIEEKKEEGEF